MDLLEKAKNTLFKELDASIAGASPIHSMHEEQPSLAMEEKEISEELITYRVKYLEL